MSGAAYPRLPCGHSRRHYAYGNCVNCYRRDRRTAGVANVRTHGYGGYTQGCKCGICRAAKAAYMAKRRAEALRATDKVIEGIRHGTRYAYEERGCRCDVCMAAQVQRDGGCGMTGLLLIAVAVVLLVLSGAIATGRIDDVARFAARAAGALVLAARMAPRRVLPARWRQKAVDRYDRALTPKGKRHITGGVR